MRLSAGEVIQAVAFVVLSGAGIVMIVVGVSLWRTQHRRKAAAHAITAARAARHR
jgi:hypothetical protein